MSGPGLSVSLFCGPGKGGCRPKSSNCASNFCSAGDTGTRAADVWPVHLAHSELVKQVSHDHTVITHDTTQRLACGSNKLPKAGMALPRNTGYLALATLTRISCVNKCCRRPWCVEFVHACPQIIRLLILPGNLSLCRGLFAGSSRPWSLLLTLLCLWPHLLQPSFSASAPTETENAALLL